MARTHFYFVGLVGPELTGVIVQDLSAIVAAMNSPRTFLDAPEVTFAVSAEDPTKFVASAHLHALAADKPKQIRKAFVDAVDGWKTAGALVDELRVVVDGAPDDDVLDERPEMKRRKNGEVAPKPTKILLEEAKTQVDLAMSAMNELRAMRDDALESARAETAARVLAEQRVASLQNAREESAKAARDEVATYVAIVDAVRALRANPEGKTEWDALMLAFAPFQSPED